MPTPAAKTKPLRAVALGYRPGSDVAPRVLATGQGLVAEKIIAIARQNDITLREDAGLVAALATVQVDAVIPPELYAVVAEVLAYVYRLKKQSPV